MTFTIIALLCLGLTLYLGTAVPAGAVHKANLTVQPDSVVYKQTTVTFLCEGTRGAKTYRLYKNEYQYLRRTEIPQNPKNKAEFSISKVDQQHAGQYRCRYQNHDGWSQFSDSLELVVTGVYSKPSLSAQPSPAVTEGGNVTLQCISRQSYHWFILTKEGPQKRSWTLDSQYNYDTKQFYVQFSVGPVTSNQRWTFRCYSVNKNSPQVWSEPSDPLELLVSGTLHKPNIKANPSSVVAYRNAVTIWCLGTLDGEICFLYKEGSQKPLGTQVPEKLENKFFIPSVDLQHVGKYRCYCYSSAGWLEHSDTLELVMTGTYSSKPSLTALPGPVVTSGENMTLKCVSSSRYDKFILTKEDQKFLSSLNSQYIHSIMQWQALFSIDHVTPDHRGTFRCYGYRNDTPQLWSVPSEPLEIHILGPVGASNPPPSKPMPTYGLEMYLKGLVTISVASLLFVFIFIFLLFRQRHQGKLRKDAQKGMELQLASGAEEPITRDRGPQKRSNPAAATQEEIHYISVEDTQPEDGAKLDSWAAESEETQDVTYAQLCTRSLRQGTAAPTPSQAGEASEEPTVYAALAVTQPGSVPSDKEQ